MEDKILKIIQERGPLTGAEIMEHFEDNGLGLWRACLSSERLIVQSVGRRYLRLDRRIDGFARLSPSILREFLTYSVIGTSGDLASLRKRLQEIDSRAQKISRDKSELIYSNISMLMNRWEEEHPQEGAVCFIIAGDIVYNMAHDVPRPERSTKKLVKGSDMDMVVIVDDQFSPEHMEMLDEAIYQEKLRLLMMPHLREEIDYVVKDLDRIREQLKFDTFKKMVACKILREGTLLYGSEELFNRVKGMLMEFGVLDKLDQLEKRARLFREEAIAYLLGKNMDSLTAESLDLFYPSEESEEFT
jgi:hypothetical protein